MRRHHEGFRRNAFEAVKLANRFQFTPKHKLSKTVFYKPMAIGKVFDCPALTIDVSH